MARKNEDGLQYGDLSIPKAFLPKTHEGISADAEAHWQRDDAEQLFYNEVRKSMLQSGYPNHVHKALGDVNRCFVCESALPTGAACRVCSVCGSRYVQAAAATEEDYATAFVVER